MTEEQNNTNNLTPENNINPTELNNKPEENSVVEDKPAVSNNENPVTLTPEKPEEETPALEMPKPAASANGEIPPVQTDLNQVPPTPATTSVASNDMTNTGFTEKVDKAKNIKKPLIIVGCLVLVALLGYFVIYPIVAEKFMSSPKNVFEASLNKVSTNVNRRIEQVKLGASLYDIEGTFDTNIEELKQFANYTFKFRGGMDSKNKLVEGAASLVGNDNKEVGASVFIKNGWLYYKLSSDERIVKAEDLSQSPDYKSLFETKETIKSEDLQYLVDKVKELLFSQFKDEDFTKENNYVMKVNGSEVKTTKNNLTIDKAKFSSMYKAITDGLYKDAKSMEIIAKLGTSKEDFKNDYMDVDYNEIDNDFKIIVNIYTVKADVVGFDLNSKDQRVIYYYSNDGNFESALMPGDENEVSFVGVKDGDSTNATLKSGKDELAKFKIYTFTDTEVKFDYTFDLDESSKMTGTIGVKEDGNTTELEFSANSGKEYIKLKGKVKINEGANIASFDESKAVTLTEEEQEKMFEAFLESTKGTPLDFLTANLGGMNYNNYDYYDDYDYYSITNSEDTPINSF